jgi:glyoxylase-like metal-dependent hydrolase (beta-lactamase superfamily II)
MQVGDLEILPVLDGVARFPISDPFVNMPEEAWAPHRQFLTSNDELELSLGGFLVRAGDRVVLVDTGVGRVDSGAFHGGAFLTSLAAYGVEPDAVTDVVFTHLHFDHIGWASLDGRPVFPNATYRCDGRDWEYFVDPPAELTAQPLDPDNPLAPLVAPGSGREVLEPVAGQLETWTEDVTLLPGLDVRLAAGHTPGSGIMILSSGNERAVLLGDVAHCPVELLDDEWGGIGDVDPALARRTRNALVREYEGLDIPIVASHFPGLKFGRVLAGQGKRQWVVGGNGNGAGART